MNRKIISLTFVLLTSFCALGQSKDAISFSEAIEKDNAYKHLSVLASDKYEGRETGKKGAWMAADYIRKQFKRIGLKEALKGSYFQHVNLVEVKASNSLSVAFKTLTDRKDYIISGFIPKGYTLNTKKISFISEINEKIGDDEGRHFSGKVVMCMNSDRNFMAKIKYLESKNVAGVIVIDTTIGINWDPKTAATSRLEYKGAWFKSDEYLKLSSKPGLPFLLIGTKVANMIFAKAHTTLDVEIKKIEKTTRPLCLDIDVDIKGHFIDREIPVKADNVVGFLEGSDPELKHEVLVISSHYDHIGIASDAKNLDSIHNGADDDGSGTTGLLLIAEALSNAKKVEKGPKRSVLFVTFVGEEKGLWGSDWYSDNPVLPLKNTIANLNIDMIGCGDKIHEADNNFVYIIGADMLSSDLDRTVKKANNDYVGLQLDERYNSRTDPRRYYYRSDHYNFAKHRIPVIFFFNGTHKDYHKVSDEIDKIDFPMLVKRAQLVYYTAWELTNAGERPVVDKE